MTGLFGLGLALVAARRLRRRRGAVEAATPGDAAFLALTDTLEHAGHARAAHKTPSEYLDDLVRDATLATEVIAAAEIVVRTFERERFALTKPTERDVAAAREACDRVRTLVGRR